MDEVFGDLGVLRLRQSAYRRAAVSLPVKPVGKPDAGNPHVRFDERGGETDPPCGTAPLLDSTGSIFLVYCRHNLSNSLTPAESHDHRRLQSRKRGAARRANWPVTAG